MIEVKNLYKYYGDKCAVEDLSFSLSPGKVYGLLGPNGAGKSTTMNIMTGCLSASSGEITIDGYDIYEDSLNAKKKMGYLPELPPLYQETTVEEYLGFVAMVKGLKGNEKKDEVERVVKIAGLEDVKKRLIRNLSKGYKQRVGIAMAIVNNPEIIILDEPTVGLDPIQIIEIRDLIKGLGKDHLVVLSSHILSEISNICDEILIISKGKLVARDTPENLEKNNKKETQLIVLTKASAEKIEAILKELADINSYEIKEVEGKNEITLHVDPNNSDAISEKIFELFAKEKEIIYKLDEKKVSLEEVFIELTEDKEEIEDDSNLS